MAASLGAAPVERLRCPTDIPFFTSQQKIVLENSGLIDPEEIDEYIAADGYRALVTALTEDAPGGRAAGGGHAAACAAAAAAAIRPV